MGISYKVLEAVQHTKRTLNLNELADSLHIERSALDGIIEFWTRKGKIVRVNDTVCSSADCSHCPIPCPIKTGLPGGMVVYQATQETIFSSEDTQERA